jgi:hypothetical protein
MRTLQRITVAGVAAAIALTAPAAAFAHEHRAVGTLAMTVGWLNEPTYAGSVNAVQLELASGGGPVTAAALQVTVIFGDRNGTVKTSPLDLVPSDETPGLYTANIVPSRPGTYTFHVTGTAAGSHVDQYFTSSDKTFDDVKDPTADEFPAKDPTVGQLAQRLDRTDAQVGGLRAAKVGWIIALAVAAVALVVGVAALVGR